MDGQDPEPSKITASFSLEDSHHSIIEDPDEEDRNSHMRAHGFHTFISEAESPAATAWKSSSQSSLDKGQVSSSGRQASNVPLPHEKESICQHVKSASAFHKHSPPSSLHHSRKNHPGSIRSAAKFFRSKSVSLKSSDGDPTNPREDGGEASVKESGSSFVSYSDLEAAEYGSHAYIASDMEFGNWKGLSLPKKNHQLYDLRRKPKPSKRFEDQNYTMEIMTRKNVDSIGDIEKGYACSECGREFGSSKALFAHMRCHPERKWKGINRPKRPGNFVDSDNKSSSGSQWQNSSIQTGDPMMIQSHFENKSDAESIEAAHMSGELKSNLQMWTTGKRSKRSCLTVSPLQTGIARQSELEVSNPAEEFEEDRYAVDCLVMLANAGKVQEELEHASKSVVVGLPTVWGEITQFDGFSEASEEHEKIELQTGDDEGEGEPKSKYECSSCMQVFKSHQALGGHRASHKKVKGCYAKAHATEWGPEGKQEDLSGEDLSNAKPSCQDDSHKHPIHAGDKKFIPNHGKKQKSVLVERIKVHRCSICLRIFPSGQALGGHKRCHGGGTGSLELSKPHSFCQKQHMVEFQRSKHSREELLDLNLRAPRKEEAASTLHFKVKFEPNSHIPDLTTNPTTSHAFQGDNCSLRLISSGGDAHQMESRTSFEGKLSYYASTCNKPFNAIQKVPSASQEVSHMDSTAFDACYVQHNICDQVSISNSTSNSNLSSHQRTYTSTVDSIPGPTPIST